MKILIVDDDAHIREAISVGFQLQWPDSEILAAKDCEDGLAQFFEHTPTWSCSTWPCPARTASRSCARSAASRVPVIMLTARGEETDQVRGLEMGAEAYVPKPFELGTLLQKLAYLAGA